MKTIFLFLFVVLAPFNILAEEKETVGFDYQEFDNRVDHNYSFVTIGFLNGGGSLIGLDIENPLYKSLTYHLGFGFIGYGAGLHYHLNRHTTRSSSISLQYYHQGVFERYFQSLLGPSYMYRSKKKFTFQLGMAYQLDYGPIGSRIDGGFILTGSIGIYFTHKNKRNKTDSGN